VKHYVKFTPPDDDNVDGTDDCINFSCQHLSPIKGINSWVVPLYKACEYAALTDRSEAADGLF